MFLQRPTYYYWSSRKTASRSHTLRRVVRPSSTTSSTGTSTKTNSSARRWMQSSQSRSSSSSSSTTTTTAPKKLSANATAEERRAYLHQANAEMEKYHQTKELLRQGKLVSKRRQQQQQQQQQQPTSSSSSSSSDGQHPSNALAIQLTVVGLFIVCFAATPWIGRKIAQDEDFRQTYIPAWYDYTVRKPEKPWTRQELHEQMVAVQTDLRERAIRGEFTADKLQEMQQRNNLQYHPPNTSPQEQENVPAGWNRIHPGLADDESVNED